MTTETPAARPDSVPEKFWDATTGTVNTTALLASYSELERKQGGTTKVAPASGDPLHPPATVGEALTIEKPAAPAAGNALEAAYTKASTTGKLEDADYATLEKAGFSRSTVDSFVQGRNAVFEQTKSEVIAVVGDAQTFKTMVDWAAANMTPADVAAYNNAMNTRDPSTMKLAVAGLKANYTRAIGSEGKRIDGGGTVFSGVQPFATRAEFYKAAGSKEYRTDATFRAQVETRLKASHAANPNF